MPSYRARARSSTTTSKRNVFLNVVIRRTLYSYQLIMVRQGAKEQRAIC